MALLWNIIQHFFPYFDVVHADWDAALREAALRAGRDGHERCRFPHHAAADDGTSQRWPRGRSEGREATTSCYRSPGAWSRAAFSPRGRLDSTGAVRRGDIVRSVDGCRSRTGMPRCSRGSQPRRMAGGRFRALQMPPRVGARLAETRGRGARTTSGAMSPYTGVRHSARRGPTGAYRRTARHTHMVRRRVTRDGFDVRVGARHPRRSARA